MLYNMYMKYTYRFSETESVLYRDEQTAYDSSIEITEEYSLSVCEMSISYQCSHQRSHHHQ